MTKKQKGALLITPMVSFVLISFVIWLREDPASFLGLIVAVFVALTFIYKLRGLT